MAQMPPTVRPGQPYPLGAHADAEGVNFSVFSQAADAVELCFFTDDGAETRVSLAERTAHCWHGYVRGVRPGQRYGFRVHGPWDPARGLRCNPAKLLVDPYARAITGDITWDASLYPYPVGGDDLERSETDSAPFMPRSVVVADAFDWEGDQPLRRPLHDTIVYETHLKGFTKQHPAIPDDIRGTYAGLAHPAAIEHLVSLGVTAAELLPVHQFVHEQHLVDKGLRNYWGYHSYGFFAPHGAYSSSGDTGGQVREFKQMVKALHAAGLEVILDVVYNHTGEGNHLGPMFCFKGLDNCTYYRTVEADPRFYMDYTGTGNSLNVRHPQTLMLVMDSLRYWVEDMHVDGFRFDLASTLAREQADVDQLSAFFRVIHQDPALRDVKLIAEPWDIGEGGYQVGNFPVRWCEWNGRYRDNMRDFWRSGDSGLLEFARRLTGSADLYADDGRPPQASVNFITAHDGFTLRDLVSYNDKHNEANGEENRDGESHNRSWSGGAEGPSDDPLVIATRRKQQRNFLATLLLSQGTPMLLAGDECGRSQGGNNNAYCQDNEISWLDWQHVDHELLAYTRRIIALRAEHAVLRSRRWLTERSGGDAALSDVVWLRPDGADMADADWQDDQRKAMGMFLNGEAIDDVNDAGEPLRADSLLLLFNAGEENISFVIPHALGHGWRVVVDSSCDGEYDREVSAGAHVGVVGRGLMVLVRRAAT